jgi:hypothetical protein
VYREVLAGIQFAGLAIPKLTTPPDSPSPKRLVTGRYAVTDGHYLAPREGVDDQRSVTR